MTKKQMTAVLPYAGIPVLGLLLLLWRGGTLAPFALLQYEILLVFGYAAAVCDIKTKKIPNLLVLVMLGAWLLSMLPQFALHMDAAMRVLLDAFLGFAVAGGLFMLVYLVSRKGLGGGDVKLMAVAGLYLGMNGVLPTMLYGSILAGLCGVVLILMKRIGRKDAIPLAPFLYIGMLITMFFL